MWPRELYYLRERNRPLEGLRTALHKKCGVYVLYRDDHPYYVGKTKKSLWRRIRDHALNRKDRYFNFWNYFSVYVVPDGRHIDEIEGVLITAIGVTANSANPKIHRIPLPDDAVKILRGLDMEMKPIRRETPRPRAAAPGVRPKARRRRNAA
mgnify:FL=1